MGGFTSKDQKRMFEAMLNMPLRLSAFSKKYKVWEHLLDVELATQTVYDPETGEVLGSTGNLRWTWSDDGVKCDVFYASGLLGILRIFPASPDNLRKGHVARFVLNILGLKTSGKVVIKQ